MSPYAVMETQMGKNKTKVIKRAGKMPKWNETFEIVIESNDQEVKLMIFDKGIINDEIIGETVIPFSEIVRSENPNWHQLFYEDRLAAEICIQATRNQ